MSINHPSFPARLTPRGVAELACVCLSVSLAAAESPHGTPIEARLLTPISTYRAKPGMEIAAAVATPLCAGGASVLPEGTELRGVVKLRRDVVPILGAQQIFQQDLQAERQAGRAGHRVT